LRFGLSVANFGSYADPRRVVALARAAEAAGWDAMLLWDHLSFVWGPPSADPWVTLGAVAASTERLLLGTAVTPLPRRRPHLLALEALTLDVLSRGRAILGLGLGGIEREFTAFGEPREARARAERLDEGLDLVRRLLGGERVDHRGRHYTVADVQLTAEPRRIPIWVGGNSAAARRRAMRVEGWIADSLDRSGMTMGVAELAAIAPAGIEVAVLGVSEPGEQSPHASFAGAGATWWLECLWDDRGPVEAMLARVEAGP
jgi:alkanesulfonate monooxygenase SsuD/methylene tetrahydromethanopterin reductase-like flavin-dependent oxidoreductase (luciferase family)